MSERKDLGFLGPEFQYRLIHHFMDDKKFFRDVCDLVDQNMFTDVHIRKFFASLQGYFKTYDHVPSYEGMEIELLAKANTEIDAEFIRDNIEKIRNTTCEGADSIKSKAHKFFKQQNLVKVHNEMGALLKLGDIDRYDELEEMIRKALSDRNRDEIGTHLRDNLGEVLSEDYRSVIPTGVGGIDSALEGGLGKGELGVIIGPSSFGKTSLTTSYANYAASKGFKVVQIVFEDKEKQIQRKHIGKITGIESRDLSKPENIEMVREIMKNDASFIDTFDKNLIIKKFNTGEISPIQVRNYLKRLINSGFNPELVILDYFECLIPSKNYKDQWQGEGHTMRQLESLASDFNIALWVPTQGTKDSLNAEVVTMDKAGGSMTKIQIAHIVISIARSMEDIENNIATIAILKNRSGKSGSVMKGAEFNNGTCVIDTSKITMYENWSEYTNSEDTKTNDMTKDLLVRVKERRERENNNK